MAFPTIPTTGAGRLLTANQLNTTATRTFPAFSGLTFNDGDLLVAVIVAYQSSGSPAFSSWSNGFTEFTDQNSGTTLAIGAAYKVASGAESGSLTVTQAATITGDCSMILMSIPGAHGSTAPEAGTKADGTSAAADPASFNPANWDAEDTLWISVVGSGMTSGTGSWTATGTTAPTNYTDRVDTNASDTSTIGDCEGAVAFRQLNAASEDVGTAGVDTSNARNSALVIAVRPANVVTITPAQLTHTRDIFSPTVSPEVLPDLLVHNRDIYGPTVSLGTTLTPDRLDHTRDIFSPAVSPSLAPVRLDHDRAIFSLQTNVVIPLVRLDHTRDIFSPTIPGAGGGPALDKTAIRRRRRRKVV